MGTLKRLVSDDKDNNYLSFRKVYNHNYRYVNQFSNDADLQQQGGSAELITASNYDYSTFPPNINAVTKRAHFEKNDDVETGSEDQQQKTNAAEESANLLSFSLSKRSTKPPTNTNV